jgi:hypothetical protein
MALNKKPSIYLPDSDAQLLNHLSKAALLDIVVSRLRLACDKDGEVMTLAEINEQIRGDLVARGDKPLTAPKARRQNMEGWVSSGRDGLHYAGTDK